MITTIFGHRGIPAKFIENSLTGFEYVANFGEGVEFDVQLTKDLIPVVMHDERIDRTTNGRGFIKNLSLTELRQFHLVNDPNWQHQQMSHFETIPTLAEVLAIFKNTTTVINIELKTDRFAYPGIEAQVLEILTAFDLTQRTTISSFNLATLQRVKLLSPIQRTAYLSEQEIQNPDFFIQKYQLDALHLKWQAMYFGSQFKQRLWTVNSADTMKKIMGKKVAGIFTDDFELAAQFRKQI
ncbi:glycerophosphodiester phosphodiesterase [Weissella diestrammenae]|uniref:Glycerophosphodiester phosphodiesterase n=1 Tax=Weissella diestrammenae TaxID=1162633 RepID=A0A7G9T570_9LACO|nr:glycerophosphodiester phosphodiesterase family protein [Weissella diestrammenae]MCM0583101.1 glycerophosphodiester phosphodiesterase [Weissella diestrammenae]QNN75245.1 glycerophosphodiester phosphodiesterase [Weissella diestrammenae]